MLEKFNFIKIFEKTLNEKIDTIYNKNNLFLNNKNFKKIINQTILKSHYTKIEKKILMDFFKLDFKKFYLKYKNKFNKNEKISFEIGLAAFDYFENECCGSYFLKSTFLEVVDNIYKHLIENNLKKRDDFVIGTSYQDIEEKIIKILNNYNYINN